MVFTRKEKGLLYDSYFAVIRETEQFIEVRSLNTGHCWNVFKEATDGNAQFVDIDREEKNGDVYRTMLAPGMAFADVNNDGNDEIVVAGKYLQVTIKEKSLHVESWDSSQKLVITQYAYSSSGLKRSFYSEENTLNGFTSKGIWDSGTGMDCSYAPVSVEGVYMNGAGNSAYVFIGGDLYDLSNNEAPMCIYTNDYVKDGDGKIGTTSLSVNFIGSTAVGNFDANAQGFEQIVYVLGRKQSGQGDYYFSIGMLGIDSTKRDANTGLPNTTNVSEAVFSTSNNALGSMETSNKGDDLSQGLNFQVTAVDFDNDGVMAKYNSKTYSYSDPEVLAVLQAAPRFEDLSDYYYDGFSTTYSINESISYTKGDSNSVSFGVGATVSMEGTIRLLKKEQVSSHFTLSPDIFFLMRIQ